MLFVSWQVVWVASESLGVGRAIDGDLCVVVAFYEPPGNMEGSFADNVLRMGSAVRERKSKELKGFVPPAPGESGWPAPVPFSFNPCNHKLKRQILIHVSFDVTSENLLVLQ